MGLADLALDVFSCPATSVDVERLFYRAGRNVTSLRNSMKARKLAKVVAVGQWFLDDWVPTDLLQRVLQAENEAKVRAREAKRRKRVADEDAAKKRRKTNNGQTAADGDD
ncbi:hypothetical protein OC842_007368 [Tilletia horrida]|uniref:HAT C-terminal dimerisation domain-containing protein n=1 Tax=Tilletia horrida TaxID=155126 RepID=A0AAN6JH66_9BASI|nr:hypothetical protein OC842_007368 [Tilletia horrida]